MLLCLTFWRIAWLVLFGSGSRKLVLSDTCIPKVPFRSPSDQQHGKEGSKEGSRRSPSPQGDESDEGKEGVEVEAIRSVAMLPPG